MTQSPITPEATHYVIAAELLHEVVNYIVSTPSSAPVGVPMKICAQLQRLQPVTAGAPDNAIPIEQGTKPGGKTG